MRTKISCFTYSAITGKQQNAERCYQYLLIRLLLGTLKVQFKDKKVNQKKDYSKITPQIQNVASGVATREYLNLEMGHKTTKSFIKKALPVNRKLYEEILLEFSNYFYQTEQKSHTAAFIFLYRILERLSFSVPLLYASTSKDYYATFDDLKKNPR